MKSQLTSKTASDLLLLSTIIHSPIQGIRHSSILPPYIDLACSNASNNFHSPENRLKCRTKIFTLISMVIFRSNQEAISKIQDLDLTITLPESNNSVNVSTNLYKGMKLIKPILEQRLVLAKRKESLRYGIQTGKFPTWFHTRIVCTLNLVGEDNEKFEKFWQDTFA